MVYLNKIYTKTGDAGETSLGNGDRVSKTDPRIIAYGAVDELNSLLGMCLAAGVPESLANKLKPIQNDLFDLGADLCVPETGEQDKPASPPLRVEAGQVARLEQWIDELNEPLAPLTSFVLPGGTKAAAHLHLARAVCRRVEIGVYQLMEQAPINPQVAVYLNRLSDLLFVMARTSNGNGRADVLWVPGANRSDSAR